MLPIEIHLGRLRLLLEHQETGCNTAPLCSWYKQYQNSIAYLRTLAWQGSFSLTKNNVYNQNN